MTSDSEAAFHSVLWPDAAIEEIIVDYDTVRLTLLDYGGGEITKVVSGVGYIGFSIIGMWDESIVEKAELLSEHPLIDDCVARITKLYRGSMSNVDDSGSPERNSRQFQLLRILLLDGMTIDIVAAEFRVTALPKFK